jgi:hypothetical protein
MLEEGAFFSCNCKDSELQLSERFIVETFKRNYSENSMSGCVE